MPKPEKPLTDCERRRNAMERLNKQQTMIAGYKNYLDNARITKDETGIRKETEKYLKITIEARDQLVSELRTMPPCLIFNCPDHTTLEAKNSVPKNPTENSKTNDNDKKPSQKRKNNSDDFVFPSNTARPTTPTKVLEPVEVQNSYDNLDEDPEINVPETIDKPAPSPPLPIFLKIKDNYRDQLNKIMQKFPNVKSKSSGKHIKLNIDCHVEHKELVDFMDEDRDIEFYVIKPKESKPIKVVVRGLPGCTKPNEIISNLEDQGYTVTSANQLISKRTKLELPFFLITMPRNKFNLTVFDLTHLGFMQSKAHKSNRVLTFNLLIRHWFLTYWPHLFNHRTENNSARHPQIQIWDGGICLGSSSQIESRKSDMAVVPDISKPHAQFK
ncbi:uncharacterized protein TNCV_3552871 [Trichonephila clavipes]|nr:uncharacterized protein TNCV_3552871 [Trichonephila clavipes]